MTTPPLVLAPPEKLAELARLRSLKAERDRQRLAAGDVFAALEYETTPKQQVFHAATEFDALSGGGKSRALTAEGIRQA